MANSWFCGSRLDASAGNAGKCLDNQRCAGFGEHVEQFHGGLIGRDLDGLLQENGAGIQALFKQHGGVACVRVAHGYRPLDRCCSAIFRQQRPMQIDTAQARQRQHPRRKDAAVRDNHDGVGSYGLKLSAEVGV